MKNRDMLKAVQFITMKNVNIFIWKRNYAEMD